MKFSVSDLLDQLRGDAVLPLTNLEKKLALKTAVEKAQLELALQALAKVGVIASAEEGISRASNDAIFEARVRSSSKGFALPCAKTEARTSTCGITSSTMPGMAIGFWSKSPVKGAGGALQRGGSVHP